MESEGQPRIALQSFSIKPSKKAPQRNENTPARDFITSVSADGQIQSVVPKVEAGPLVIPLHLQRTFLNIKSKPSTGDVMEDDLDREAREAVIAMAQNREEKKDLVSVEAIPLLKQNMVPGLEDIGDEKERLKHDISLRPDEASLEAYENVPIDAFGEAMIRGMGWAPGKPIGLNSTVVIKPIEFVPRHHRGGLGSEIIDEMPQGTQRGSKKRGYAEEEKKPKMRMPDRPDGRKSHVKSIDDEMIEVAPTKLKKGILVLISGGRHEGLSGRIVDIDEDKFGVKLTRSEEVVKIFGDQLMIVDEPQLNYDRKYGLVTGNDIKKYAKAPSKVPSSRDDRSDRSSKRDDQSTDGKLSRDDTKSRDERDLSQKSSKDEKGSSKKSSSRDKMHIPVASWLQPHIRVRIVSKKINQGTVYLKKGDIVDIPQPGSAIVRMEDGQMCEVREKDLETALPKPGGRVLVLRGQNVGKQATLLEKDSDKNRGVIQMIENYEAISCSLDDIAESTSAGR